MFFISSQTLFPFLGYLNFCPDVLGHVGKGLRKKGLIRKLRLISKFMTSSTGKQIITIHIFPNISRSKGNQAINFGQLIEFICEKDFSSKIMQKARRRDKCQGSCFVKKLNVR